VLYLTGFGLIAGFTMVAFVPTPAWEWWWRQGSGDTTAAAEAAGVRPPALRLRVDARAMTRPLVEADDEEGDADPDAIKKKTDEDQPAGSGAVEDEAEEEWCPPTALALALLISGVTTTTTTTNGDGDGVGPPQSSRLLLEPAPFQSTEWCVVADAKDKEEPKGDSKAAGAVSDTVAADGEDDEESRLRAELESMSLPELHRRARDPHALLIEQDILEAALHR
jgi:hypothetical protein